MYIILHMYIFYTLCILTENLSRIADYEFCNHLLLTKENKMIFMKYKYNYRLINLNKIK